MKQAGLLPKPGELLGPIERRKVARDPWKVVTGLERNVPALYADLCGGPNALELSIDQQFLTIHTLFFSPHHLCAIRAMQKKKRLGKKKTRGGL